jgi:predicted enzyme related to lactoylglutathione lyase
MNAPRLMGVALIVPDYDLAIAFFVNVLQFRLTADQDQGTKRWVVVTPANGGAGLILAQAEGQLQRDAIGKQGAGRVWLFLHTDDFARDYTRMVQLGVLFEEQPRVEPYGRVAVWQDPWGNRWDLIQSSADVA